jgi:hypothetical protein
MTFPGCKFKGIKWIMDRSHFAPPIIAAFLLAVPILYVGSYLVLVKPDLTKTFEYYRFGGETAARIYWPLERIDRQFRHFHSPGPYPCSPVVDPTV